jgi:hypothetical protein
LLGFVSFSRAVTVTTFVLIIPSNTLGEISTISVII